MYYLLVICALLVFGACASDQSQIRETDEIALRSTDDDEAEDVYEADENEIEINPADLPQEVLDGLNAQFESAILLEADQITHEDGSVTYDVEMRFEGRTLEVMFDAAGQFLGEEVDP